jgi:hypothetical protein
LLHFCYKGVEKGVWLVDPGLLLFRQFVFLISWQRLPSLHIVRVLDRLSLLFFFNGLLFIFLGGLFFNLLFFRGKLGWFGGGFIIPKISFLPDVSDYWLSRLIIIITAVYDFTDVGLSLSVILLGIFNLYSVSIFHLGLCEYTFVFLSKLFLSCHLIRGILSHNFGRNSFYVLVQHVQCGFEILLVKVLRVL